MDKYKEIIEKIKEFRDKRDWKQYHDPKNMAISIMIEGAELLEHFQWKSKEETEKYLDSHKEDVSDEMADIAMYLFGMADDLGIDLLAAMENKLRKNEEKYPVEKFKGTAKKYTDI